MTPTEADPMVSEDGSVRVPQSLAAAVHDAVLLHAGACAQAGGGSLTGDARHLLDALNAAAAQRVSPTKPAGQPPATVVMLGMGKVAALLGCSPQYARRLAARGDLAGAQRVGRTWVIASTDLDAYRDETEEAPHGEPGPDGAQA